MAFIKPTLDADAFASTTSSGNDNFGKLVPAGDYTVTIGKTAVIRRSKNNADNQYFNIQLNHTGEYKGSKPAFAMIMTCGYKADGSPIKLGKLAKFLTALGITADDDYAIDYLDDGDNEKAISITVRGDTVALEGKTVRARLEVETGNDGVERNTVAFIVPAE
jgi:hypothetical protein